MLSTVRFIDDLKSAMEKKGIVISKEILFEVVEPLTVKFDITEREIPVDATKDLEAKIEMYLTTKKIEGKSPLTLGTYHVVLKQFCEENPYRASEITTQQVRQYIAKRSAINKVSTVIHHVSVIRSFFNWLFVEGIIPKNPMDRISAMKAPKRFPKGLTVEELELVRDACKDKRSRAMVEVFYSTGARLEELCNAKISDIDFTNRTMCIIGKGDIERKVYLTHRASMFLKRYLETREGESEYLFTSIRAPFKEIGPRAVQDEFTRIGLLAKLKTPLHAHRLRHTCATFLLNNGAALSMVQAVLGHANCSITERYCQLTDRNIQDQYDRFMI